MSDQRIVYGVGCSWWDSISKVGKTKPGVSGHRLPCCPMCGSMLLEMPDEETWWRGVDAAEANGHPGYRKFIEWMRGRCYRTTRERSGFAAAAEAYRAQGGEVTL